MTVRAEDLLRVRSALGEWKIAHRVQLRNAAVSPRLVRGALQAGIIRQVRRDWFADTECSDAVVHAVHAGATLACVSAAPVHGLWDLEVPELHLCAAHNTPRILRDARSALGTGHRELVVHWTRRPEPTLAPRVRAVIVPLKRTLAQIAECRPLEDAVAVVDSALRRRKIGLDELRQAAVGRTRLAHVLTYSNALADSGLESIARVRLALRGVDMVPQVELDGHPRRRTHRHTARHPTRWIRSALLARAAQSRPRAG
ncbi:hypothetical protein [Agromyces luteolus]|uniref:Uncharacterized protein n=1 Tax=Agromyces luteolus TaxID=88373 RepID=A0A7C9HG43_9MICO|nr:hypothetical protein [Agromyces luteolus]MUN06041.1 hypothetical protein [Agromyces luteolus]